MKTNETNEVDKNVINVCLVETYKHVKRVGHFINLFVKELIDRSEHHDDSKFQEPELSGFARNTSRLAEVQYGTQEYKDMLKSPEIKATVEHHYSKNRHHTEHWPKGIEDMNLVDVLELLADWRAATERNKAGNIRTSIEENSQKYNISPQLRKILENTVRDFFKD